MNVTEFIVSMMTVVAIYFLLSYANRRNQMRDRDDPSKHERRVSFVRNAFASDGRFIEEIMQICFKNPHAKALFQDYHHLVLRERRNAFCEMCLEASATDERGVIEVAVLSAEFASMYRVAIGFLPKEYQHFYKTTRPVSTFHLHDHLFETEDMLTWSELHLPEEGKEQRQKIQRLVQAFASGRIILRFKRTPETRIVPFSPVTEKQEEGNNK